MSKKLLVQRPQRRPQSPEKTSFRMIGPYITDKDLISITYADYDTLERSGSSVKEVKTWPTATDEILQLATDGPYGEAIYISFHRNCSPLYCW